MFPMKGWIHGENLIFPAAKEENLENFIREILVFNLKVYRDSVNLP